mgnify:CR=1 FL=1
MIKVRDKIGLEFPSERLFNSNMDVYRTILPVSLTHSSSYVQSDIKGVPVYTSIFDEGMVVDRRPEIGALWTGFTPHNLKFMQAVNDLISFWLVPNRAAWSLQYFFGKSNELWQSQRVKLLPINYTVHISKDEQMKFSKTPTIGLWLDFDSASSDYFTKVFAFIRCWQWIMDANGYKDGESEFSVKFKLLTYKRDEIAWNDIGINVEDYEVSTTDNFIDFCKSIDYYFSLEEKVTAFDPIIQLLEQTMKYNITYAPPRMDVVCGNSYRELPAIVLRALNALVGPGSQGVEPAAQAIIPFFNTFKEHIEDDFIIANE